MNRDDFAKKYGWDGKEKACEGALRWIDTFPPDATADDIWQVLSRADWALWLLKRLVNENDRRFRMMACEFLCRDTIMVRSPIKWSVEDIIQDQLKILKVSEQNAQGIISDEKLKTIASSRPSPAERLAEKAARATAIFPAIYAAIASAEKCRLCAAAVAREEDPEVVHLEKVLKEAHAEQYMAGSLLAREWEKDGQNEAVKVFNDSRITALGIVSQLERARMVAERKAIETASLVQCQIIREYFPSVGGL